MSRTVQGPYSGSGNGLYPAAARFFESLRILEHKPKSAHRVKEEAAFGKYGRATWSLPNKIRCYKDDYPTRDEVGRVRVIKVGPRPNVGEMPSHTE